MLVPSVTTRSGSSPAIASMFGANRETWHLGGRLARGSCEVVDGDHLVAGADREQHLGRGRRERDDPRRHVGIGRRRGRCTAVGGASSPAGAVVAGGGRGAGVGRRGGRRHGIGRTRRRRRRRQRATSASGRVSTGSVIACAGIVLHFGRTSRSRPGRPANRPCLEGLVVAHGAVDRACPDRAGTTVAGQRRDRTGLR